MGTLTPNRSLQVPTIGGDAGPEFAEEINATITATDLICGGLNVLNVGGSANVTLTTDQAQNMIQQFTGVLTGNITVFAPATGAFYAVENATTGNFSLSFGCLGGGNAQVIPAGLSTWLWTDGSFTRLSNPPGWQEIATYTVSNAANLIILLPGPFRRFRLTMDFTLSTSGAALCAQFSNNGGASYSVSGYKTNAMAYYGSTLIAGETNTSSFVISIPTVPVAGYDGTMEIYPGKLDGSTGGVNFRSNGVGYYNAVSAIVGENRTGVNGAIPGANAMSISPGFIANAGNITQGVFILEGLP